MNLESLKAALEKIKKNKNNSKETLKAILEENGLKDIDISPTDNIYAIIAKISLLVAQEQLKVVVSESVNPDQNINTKPKRSDETKTSFDEFFEKFLTSSDKILKTANDNQQLLSSIEKNFLKTEDLVRELKQDYSDSKAGEILSNMTEIAKNEEEVERKSESLKEQLKTLEDESDKLLEQQKQQQDQNSNSSAIGEKLAKIKEGISAITQVLDAQKDGLEKSKEQRVTIQKSFFKKISEELGKKIAKAKSFFLNKENEIIDKAKQISQELDEKKLEEIGKGGKDLKLSEDLKKKIGFGGEKSSDRTQALSQAEQANKLMAAAANLQSLKEYESKFNEESEKLLKEANDYNEKDKPLDSKALSAFQNLFTKFQEKFSSVSKENSASKDEVKGVAKVSLFKETEKSQKESNAEGLMSRIKKVRDSFATIQDAVEDFSKFIEVFPQKLEDGAKSVMNGSIFTKEGIESLKKSPARTDQDTKGRNEGGLMSRIQSKNNKSASETQLKTEGRRSDAEEESEPTKKKIFGKFTERALEKELSREGMERFG